MSSLPQIADILDLAAIRSALIGTRFTCKLEHFQQIESTSTLLLEAAAANAPEGTAYLADEQTAGRGRGGHTWHSAPGDGLYLSVLAKPYLLLRDALHLSLATGLAAQSAIRSASGLTADIRWPNDILIHGKKCGGILVETAAAPGPNAILRYAVIGIGLNLNHAGFPPELAQLATSLRLESGRIIARQPLLIALLRALDYELTQLESNAASEQPTLLERFSAASSWITGKRVQVPEQGGYTGTTAGLDSRGFLLVDSDDGTQRTVLSGGVREL